MELLNRGTRAIIGKKAMEASEAARRGKSLQASSLSIEEAIP